MPIRYGRFEMPKTLTKDESTATDTYAKFTAEPFEAGYGHTVGNSLRRVLLSSLEGAAITAVKITGAQHDFATLPGVVEDVCPGTALLLSGSRGRVYAQRAKPVPHRPPCVLLLHRAEAPLNRRPSADTVAPGSPGTGVTNCPTS